MAAGSSAPLTVRDKITLALTGVQASVPVLAKVTGLTPRVVRVELETMGRQGLVRSKVTKPGIVLYRRPDAVDSLWDRHRSQLNFATA